LYSLFCQVTSREVTWQNKLYNINVVELMFFQSKHNPFQSFLMQTQSTTLKTLNL